MLDATLTVRPSDDGMGLLLAVENAAASDETLSFRSGKRADFVALDDGEEVWRWSDGRMFTQVLGEEVVAAGETKTYSATWPTPDPGEYTVRGELCTVDRDVTAEMAVTIPE
ncbi:BsuPI-related putative proteinase inhibitor [Haloferacaceae archaeon DSL9]